MAAQREAVRKNKEAIEAHRKKKEEASAPAPDGGEEILTPAAAAYGIIGDMQAEDALSTKPVPYELGEPRPP